MVVKRTFVHLVAGARPNFMKIAPLYHSLEKEPWCECAIVHTGQHYDQAMSGTFFQDLRLPRPHIDLRVGSGTHAYQTGNIMISYEKVCMDRRPDITIVVGDVNSTLACTLSAKKLLIPVVHLEAGLRSRDRTMPEEINRLVTDTLSDLLLTPSEDANENLRMEGITEERVKLVGNIMIDSFEMLRESINRESMPDVLHIEKNRYAVLTLHRPENVDDESRLAELCRVIEDISRSTRIVFPIHPRTRSNLAKYGLLEGLNSNVVISEPIGYIKFMNLVQNSRFVITDSGGIQEETTYLNIPCLTLRKNTERPVTIEQGTNRLVDPGNIMNYVDEILSGRFPSGKQPKLWDGRTAGRVVNSLKEFLASI